MERAKGNRYIWLYGALLVYSVSTVCAKLASGQAQIGKLLFFLALEVACLGVYAIVWQQVLKRFALVTAVASKGVVIIINLVWSAVLFHEAITLCNILGSLIIIFGIWVVSSDD